MRRRLPAIGVKGMGSHCGRAQQHVTAGCHGDHGKGPHPHAMRLLLAIPAHRQDPATQPHPFHPLAAVAGSDGEGCAAAPEASHGRAGRSGSRPGAAAAGHGPAPSPAVTKWWLNRGRGHGMPKPTVKTELYREGLLESLRDPDEAARYLNACLEDEDRRVFLPALRDVADAHGGIRMWSPSRRPLNGD